MPTPIFRFWESSMLSSTMAFLWSQQQCAGILFSMSLPYVLSFVFWTVVEQLEWHAISKWFWFVFPSWSVVLSMYSCTCWASLYLPLRNFCLLSTFFSYYFFLPLAIAVLRIASLNIFAYFFELIFLLTSLWVVMSVFGSYDLCAMSWVFLLSIIENFILLHNISDFICWILFAVSGPLFIISPPPISHWEEKHVQAPRQHTHSHVSCLYVMYCGSYCF